MVNASITGPILRAGGVDWDLRHRNPYDFYDQIEFNRPLHVDSDNFSRFWDRIQEGRESLKIIRQCIDNIKPGPVRSSFEDVPRLVRPPEGDAYVSIEGSKGELGFYLVSDGSISPYRCNVRAPSLINLTLLREMLIGQLFNDLFVSFVSLKITTESLIAELSKFVISSAIFPPVTDSIKPSVNFFSIIFFSMISPYFSSSSLSIS